MEPSKESAQTSENSRLFGKKELVYLRRIAVSLQNPPMPVVVKANLTRAQADGLDPKRIYDAAVQCRPSHWMKAPDYEEVEPTPAP